jgi:hypothetical protein
MKILFKQKQWLVMQAIFVIVGVLSGLAAKVAVKGSAGGLAMGLHYVTSTDDYTLPIFLILLSDLAFNVEYMQGTFLTYLLCGQSRKSWMLKKSVTFYLFVLVQYVIAFAVISLAAGSITGHLGLEGIPQLSPDVTKIQILRELLVTLSLSILKTLLLVSFGVMVTTMLPGKLVVGSVASIGVVLLAAKFEVVLLHALGDDASMSRLFEAIWLQDPNRALTWICGIAAFALFTWFSAERVRRIEIPNLGT